MQICAGFGVTCERVTRKEDLRAAMERMLASREVYVLDVMTPYTEHVLPMIPGGAERTKTSLWSDEPSGRRPACRVNTRSFTRQAGRLPDSGLTPQCNPPYWYDRLIRFPAMRLRILLALSLLVVPAARGDDASMNEGAYGPEPRRATAGDESIVRMESEKITVRFGREKSDVVAHFVFRSGKTDAPARQLVGFPDFGAAYAEAHRRNPKDDAPWQPHENVAGAIEDMQTFVDGQPVPSKLDYGFVIEDEAVGWKPGTPKDGTLMAWHVLWVTFPPGRDVVIERRYRVPNGEMVGGITKFDYTTVTGASLARHDWPARSGCHPGGLRPCRTWPGRGIRESRFTRPAPGPRPTGPIGKSSRPRISSSPGTISSRAPIRAAATFRS